MQKTEEYLLEKRLVEITPRIQDNIKRIRKELGLTQFGLYHESGINPGAISAIECGHTGAGIVTLVRLVYAFNRHYDGPLGEITLDDIVFTDKLNIKRKRSR